MLGRFTVRTDYKEQLHITVPLRAYLSGFRCTLSKPSPLLLHKRSLTELPSDLHGLLLVSTCYVPFTFCCVQGVGLFFWKGQSRIG